jgi:hypothetical protein
MTSLTALADLGRVFIGACVAVVVCLIVVVAMPSSAQAHAGHKHGATEQSAIVGTVSPAVEWSVSLPLMLDTHAPGNPVIQLGPVVAVALEASQEILANGVAISPKGYCVCGGLCGSCTSMSCCVAVMASDGSAAFVPRTVSAALPRVAVFSAGAAVPLLQRPPIHVC